jgi:hypothetical protein
MVLCAKQVRCSIALVVLLVCQILTTVPASARCLEKYQKSLAYLHIKGKEFTDLQDFHASLAKSAEAAHGKWQWSMGGAAVLSGMDMSSVFEFLEARYPADIGKTDERVVRKQLRSWQSTLGDRLEVIALLREASEGTIGPTLKKFFVDIQKREPKLKGITLDQLLTQIREEDEQESICSGEKVLSIEELLTFFVARFSPS